MKLTIDSREQNRIRSATKYYTEQGLEVTISEEQIGDYIFTDGNNSVVFEFKLISDFISSIQDNRVFNQAINQAENYDHHYVIIMGDDHTRGKCLAMTKHYKQVTYYQYLGAIASLNRYTTVIESYSPYINEAYYRMLVTALKCLQDKPIVKRFPRKHKNAALNFLSYDIYGINYKKASKIVEAYNLNSLTDLMKLKHNDLIILDGIGEKTADKIITAIHGEVCE